MMRALLLFAEDEIGRVEGWFRIADGRVAMRGAGLDHLPLPQDDEALVLLLPGMETALRWLEIPALTEAQALGAARVALADHSLGPIADLHVAMGPLHGNHRLVAAIDRDVIGGWLGWAEGVGLDIDHVVPLPLVLAYGEGPTRVWQRPGRAVVHGHHNAFTVEPELLDAVLDDSPRETVDDARFEAELPAALAALPLDLRQGAYRRRRTWGIDAGWRGRMHRYAVAAAILIALIPLARLGRLEWDGYRLRAEAADVAQRALGLPERPADPRDALRQRLAGLQGPGVGLVDGAAILFGAVRQTPNVELAGLVFDAGGTLGADVRATNPADLAELVRHVGSSGVTVETVGGPAGTTTLRISAP